MAGRVPDFHEVEWCPERAKRVEGLHVPYVCMLRCADGTLYIGHTNDLASREQAHNDGSGSRYTAARRPVKTVYVEELDSTAHAIARERQLKHWTAKKKEALIGADSVLLKALSARRRK